jgi:hypothetical protein
LRIRLASASQALEPNSQVGQIALISNRTRDAQESFMEIDEIQKQVDQSIETWQRVAGFSRGPSDLTPGARDTLALLIHKIQTDPSQAWERFDPDDVQRFALSSIPGILNSLTRRHPSTNLRVVSTWELLHGMSGILDQFCPIPKDK